MKRFDFRTRSLFPRGVFGILMLCVSLVALVFACFSFISLAYQYDAWDTFYPTSPDETFTELYFNDIPNLPSHISKGDTLSFSFTIHNNEDRDTVYQYRVYVQTKTGDVTVLDKNIVLVKSGASASIPESHRFRTDVSGGRIVVELPDGQQHIDLVL